MEVVTNCKSDDSVLQASRENERYDLILSYRMKKIIFSYFLSFRKTYDIKTL